MLRHAFCRADPAGMVVRARRTPVLTISRTVGWCRPQANSSGRTLREYSTTVFQLLGRVRASSSRSTVIQAASSSRMLSESPVVPLSTRRGKGSLIEFQPPHRGVPARRERVAAGGLWDARVWPMSGWAIPAAGQHRLRGFVGRGCGSCSWLGSAAVAVVASHAQLAVEPGGGDQHLDLGSLVWSVDGVAHPPMMSAAQRQNRPTVSGPWAVPFGPPNLADGWPKGTHPPARPPLRTLFAPSRPLSRARLCGPASGHRSRVGAGKGGIPQRPAWERQRPAGPAICRGRR